MDVLIRAAKVIDPQSPHHEKVVDVYIENGQISAIGKNLKAGNNAIVIKEKNLHLSPGWFDIFASVGDPGNEHKEDFNSANRAAAFGGFTGVAVKPDTTPPLHSKSEINYIGNRSAGLIVDFVPLGAISYNRQGKDITEMIDMHYAGAVAFTDGDRPVENAGLMLRSLQYAKTFGGTIFSRPLQKDLSPGSINEGDMSISLGVKGSPHLAEDLMVHRDLQLTEYAESKIHFVKISTPGAIELIKKAKKAKMPVSASVSSYHLLLDEEVLGDFNSNYKVRPPLRSKKNIAKLIEALRDGTIEMICSDHYPQDEESKKKEFEYAGYGIINFQTSFAAMHTALQKKLDITKIIATISTHPRELLNLEIPVIQEGAMANMTIFDPERKWTFTEKAILSKSKNSPFVDFQFTGKALGIINKNQLYYDGKLY